MKKNLSFLICLLLFIYSEAQIINAVPKFDSKLVSYYKVDTCRVYENVNNGQQTVQYLRKLYLFNSQGDVSQEVEFGQNEFDGHTITKYEYNDSHMLTRKIVAKPMSDPIEYTYYNSGNKLEKMTTQYPYYKEYDVQTNDQGLIMGVIGNTMIQERDPITDELTGKEVFGKMEEYEYRYNRFYKVVKINYYLFYKPMYTISYEYSNNSYSIPLSMSYYKEESKIPEWTTTFSYDPVGFLHMEVTKDEQTGYTNTLEYEYAYANDSPIHDVAPDLKQGQKFWLGKKK